MFFITTNGTQEMKRATTVLVLLACATTFTSAAALGHVTANPDEGASGSYLRTALRVSHGCDGSPTAALHVEIPDNVHKVKAEAKPGWEVSVETRALEEPVESGERMLNETVEEVVWHGGRLPDAQFDEFGLVMKLPAESERTIYLPTTQECEEGVNDWTNIPDEPEQWHDIEGPAPFIRLNEGGGHH